MKMHTHQCPPPKAMIAPRIMCLSKLLRQAFNEAVAEQGLFSGQEDIILTLVINEGLTLSELSKILDVSNATASVSVKRMEKSGFIIKKPDQNDARITRLYPTEKAKATTDKIKSHMDQMEKRIKTNMTETEAEQLSILLESAIQNLLTRGEEK